MSGSPATLAAEPVVRLAARGDGLTASGRFVPLTAPGDLVSLDEAAALVTAGPHRAAPPCRHFPECGGCQLQHIDEAAYGRWMTERALHALAGVGLEPAWTAPPHISPPFARRRAAMRAVRQAGSIAIGFNAEGTHRVLDLAECHVLRPELFLLVAPLRALLPPLVPPGQAAGVTMTLSETGVDLLLSNLRADGRSAELAAFAEAQDLARLAVEGPGGVEVVALRRTPAVSMGGSQVALPPAAFLQATADGEAALVSAVTAACAGAGRVADLFSGLGTFALPLVEAGARVLAADASAAAVAALARASGGRRLETQHRDLFRRPLTPAELAPFDAVVFDPPRAGASGQAAAIARSRVPLAVAVSCNPATFARDAALLAEGGFRLERLWPVGQFRWSNHMELVAEFRRPAGG